MTAVEAQGWRKGRDLLRVEGLVAGYGRPVVGPLSFSVAAGEVIGLWGANGVGKSCWSVTSGVSWMRPARGVLTVNAWQGLPDGHTGWVDEVNDKRFAERTYTLDFAPEGLLYDFVYKSYSAERVSARQMQGLSSSAPH